MDNKGLIFIPDISGFTRFVNATEIEHSRYIIQELLEILINANQIGLEVSEIEGDAILFYKYGDAPQLNEVYGQVEKMFCDFHRSLASYELCRVCQCTACRSVSDLTLKVITHYGEFTGYNVKSFSKLIGKDIILAHQLLKNDIEQHEYWLVTDELMNSEPQHHLPEWISWNNSTKQTENGQVLFRYVHLGPLKEKVPSPTVPQLEISDRIKVFSVSREFDAEINTLFSASLDFATREKWQVGVKRIDHVSDKLPQIGTHHCCVLEKGQVIMHTSSYSYGPEKIEYSETDEKKKSAGYFTFEKLGVQKTKATFDFYLKNDFVMITMFRLFMKKKWEKAMQQSLNKLAEFVKTAKVPVEI
jgi:hypothetical protein